MNYHFQDLLRMHALWFLVFAWLFFGGATMPAKNCKVKSLSRHDLEYSNEVFHKVPSSGAQLCEVIEPPQNFELRY